jgi:DNA (cytosine-5)-methyltransferase 1
MRKLNVVELYAGTGRASAPFRRWRRANVGLLVDWNEHARLTYLHNFKRANYQHADLGNLRPDSLRTLAGAQIDILLGCPPCQGFSESGERDQTDPRNDHVVHFAQMAAALQPLAIGMENVPLAGISPHVKKAMGILECAGYSWTAGVLNAALYGSAQSRHRLVMIALRNDLNVAPSLPEPTHLPRGRYFDYVSQSLRDYDDLDDDLIGTTSSARRVALVLQPTLHRVGRTSPIPTFEDAIAGLPREGSAEASALGHVPWTHGTNILEAMRDVEEGGRRRTVKSYYGAAYARLHRYGLARTITTYFSNAGSGRYWHPTANRAITLREGARLQGFPDDFKFLGGALQSNATLVGNALDAELANATYRSIRRALE